LLDLVPKFETIARAFVQLLTDSELGMKIKSAFRARGRESGEFWLTAKVFHSTSTPIFVLTASSIVHDFLSHLLRQFVLAFHITLSLYYYPFSDWASQIINSTFKLPEKLRWNKLLSGS